MDVLGNHGLLDLLLHVASGNGDKVLAGRPLCLCFAQVFLDLEVLRMNQYEGCWWPLTCVAGKCRQQCLCSWCVHA